MAKVAVIICAAGKSERFGGSEKKILAKIDGRPVFLRTIELFMNHQDVCQTILAVAPEDLDTIKKQYGANLGFMGVKLTEGGDRRCDTVAKALELVPEDAEFVAVHDAARPCVPPDRIDAVFAEAGKSGAAILAMPVSGTLKRVSGSSVIEDTMSREGLWEAQTPQVFRVKLLRDAYAKRTPDSDDATDDAQVLEQTGHPVAVVMSDATNIKLTTKGDLALANAILKSRPSRPRPRLGAFEEAQW